MPKLQDATDAFKATGAELKRVYEAFTKRNKADKNAAYKQRRLSELKKIWEEHNTCVELIRSLSPAEDECLDDEVRRNTELYTLYVNGLNQIQDPEKRSEEHYQQSQSSQNYRDSNNYDGRIMITLQLNRFKTIQQVWDEVQATFRNGTVLTESYVDVKLRKITNLWNKIESEHEIILGMETSTPTYEQQFRKIELWIDEAAITMNEKKAAFKSTWNDGLKLSRVTIPKFQGDYFKWVTFRDLFDSMVVSNPQFSNVQRMQMLKTNLGGEAEALINDLTVSEVNFESAWERLRSRYDNNRVIIHKLVTKLMYQPTSKGDATSIRNLLDTTDQVLLALKNMGRPTENWDDWVVVVLTQKLGEQSQKDWEHRISGTTAIPTWPDFKAFLEEHFRMLERLESSQRKPDSKIQQPNKNQQIKSYHTTITKKICAACEGDHGLYSCEKWKSMAASDRWEVARKQKLCFLCLHPHQDGLRCDKQNPCKKCDKAHSTWLHEEKSKGKIIASAHCYLEAKEPEILLATAMVYLTDSKGKTIAVRALIDTGSEGSIITERVSKLFNARAVITTKHIVGLGNQKTGPAKKLTLSMKARFKSDFNITIDCYILQSLTKTMPSRDLCIKNWNHINGLVWADPKFHKKGDIDMLLGTDVIFEIMKSGIVRGTSGQPMAQETTLGWIMSGKIDVNYPKKELKCLVSTMEEQISDLSRFWELEEIHPKRQLTNEEQECERFYNETTKRDSDGRYIVKIPFKKDATQLGSSRGQAAARFLYLEKRFLKDPQLKEDYKKVMQEYEQLGHMKDVTMNAEETKKYFIPHHAVIKPESLTTKTRVVFDASAKTTSGVSFNEVMHLGSKQQDDLFDILTRWRKHQFVFKSDLEKMYRQIKLDEHDQQYHTIFWRNHPTEPLREFQLTTVTFGTAAAPYMATRTLKQIGMDSSKQSPLASKVILKDFYVDDLISGCDTLQEAHETIQQLRRTLLASGMNLRKWTANENQILQSLPAEETEQALQSFGETDLTKALGVQWNSKTDDFSFKVKWAENNENQILTKRILLSEASKLFDPLGWLAPVIIKAKILMQTVWEAKIEWDGQVPTNVMEDWIQFKREFSEISKITIPRWMNYHPESEITIHGFCDASEQAYSAVVYARVVLQTKVHVTLIASKTRVAPIRSKITLPKLELCGGVLLGALITNIQQALDGESIETYAWSDSMISLGWIAASPSKWKTFVANRVAEIQAHKINHWNYVETTENPADCASRGIMPSELKDHPLWFSGPKWLYDDPDKWQKKQVTEPTLEKRNMVVNTARIQQNELLRRSSSWFRMVRVTAYCLRMKNKTKGNVTTTELKDAKMRLLKQCQLESFPEEMRVLSHGHQISKRSNILSLNPFLDEQGLLRVGGRLENASLPYNQKHPIILPAQHPITQLIIRQMHQDTFHGGAQLITNLLRKSVWIINAKRMATTEIQRCVNCRREKGQTIQPQMGNLPEARVKLARSFSFTGVDYAGPFEIKSSNLRNAKIQKGYIALYVCLCTKALHLELVSNETTEAFLASFNRFISRRGLVNTMYSDNGRNFVGGANQLTRNLLNLQNEKIAEKMAIKGIKWEFIPPKGPNFGGIWERGVRSVKEHLKRTLKTARLTFEEYSTVLCQIEACLNSRPICPLSPDTETLDVLTPGHFLIGEALLAPPEPTLMDNTLNQVKRWKYVQLLQQRFWDRWHKEYLHTLQQRQKWNEPTTNVKIGQIVLIKEDNIPPRQWIMGKITEVHPGADGQNRVATMKVMSGNPPKATEFKRPVNKLCPLLPEEDPTTIKLQEIRNNKILEQKINSEKQKRYSLRPRRIPLTPITLIALGLMLFFGGALGQVDKNIKIQQFSTNAGIYFENVGRASMTRSHWNILVYFDISRLTYEVKNLQDSVIKLKTHCNERDAEIRCGELTSILQTRLTDVKMMNIFLKVNKHHDLRRKRGAPFNIVGWASNQLFGIMDSAEAEKFEADIALLKKNNDHLLVLMKNQTSVMEMTTNLIRLTTTEMHQGIDNVNKAITNMTNETNDLHKREQILGWLMHLSLLVDRMEKTQRNIINMLTNLEQGHVSSFLFTPAQFKKQLDKINDHLPSGSKLPANPQDDIKSFYEIMRGVIRVTENHILIDITIPLVSVSEFQVFHVIPIPTKHEGRRISIIPQSSYLLITLQKDLFYNMNDVEFEKCMKPSGGTIICANQRPLNNAKSTISQCERDLIAKRNILSPFCKFNITDIDDVWIQLQEKNKWIFDIKDKATLNIVCGSDVDTIILQGSGTMEIKSGCEVSHHGTTMIAESTIRTSGRLGYQPSVNLSNVIETSSLDWEIIDIPDHNEQINHIRSTLNEIKTNSVLEQQRDIKHTGITIGTIGIMIILATLWACRGFIKKCFDKMTRRSNQANINMADIPTVTDQDQHSVASSKQFSREQSPVTSSTTPHTHGAGRCLFKT